MGTARLGSESSQVRADLCVFKTDLLAAVEESICGSLQVCALQQSLKECTSARIRSVLQLAFPSSHSRGIPRWTPAMRLSCR